VVRRKSNNNEPADKIEPNEKERLPAHVTQQLPTSQLHSTLGPDNPLPPREMRWPRLDYITTPPRVHRRVVEMNTSEQTYRRTPLFITILTQEIRVHNSIGTSMSAHPVLG